MSTETITKPKKVLTPEQKEERKRLAAETRLANQGLWKAGDRHNKYRIVKGILLKNADVQAWDETKFVSFFDFLDRFYVVLNGKGKLNVTLEKIQFCEQQLTEEPEGSFAEFMWRIDRWTEPFDGSIHKSFYIRTANLMKIVFLYLKNHPELITDAIKEHCKGKVQYEWILSNTRVVTTKMGAEVVEHSHGGYEGNVPIRAGYADADARMIDSILKVANVYDMIASGITKKDIEKLNVKEKINALQKLSFIHTVTKNFKPNNNTFKQINIYKAGKDELEAALLDFTKQE